MALPLRSFLFVLSASILGVSAQTNAPGPTHPGIPSNCNRWHVLESGDTCATVPQKYGISSTQFFNWNPSVSRDCLTNFWLGYAYCVGVGANIPTTITSAPTTTTTSKGTVTRITTPPGPTFTDTPKNCNSWHLVEDGDTCPSVASRYGISMAQFLNYNPSVSTDCTQNFWLGQAYCVGLGPPITVTTTEESPSTSSKPTSSFNSTYSIRHPISVETMVVPTIDDTWPPQKTQSGQPSYCKNWHLVGPGEDCMDIVHKYSDWMGLSDFFAWNPEVGTDCSGLYLNYYVCVDIQPQTTGAVIVPTFAANATLPPYVSWSVAPLPTVDNSFTPTPSHGPMPTNCVDYLRAEPGYSCEDMLKAQPYISREQFFAWNPVLAGKCDAIWANNYYCVGAYSGGNFPQPPTTKSKPSPLPAGTTDNCVAWYQSTPGDTCETIIAIFGTFSMSNFIAWNPTVQSSCSSLEEMESDVWYCVAVPSTPTTRTAPVVVPTSFPPYEDDETSTSPTTTQQPPTTTSTDAAISTPQPIQGQMISGCRRFYFVQPGDGCWQICNDAGIDTSDFYKWNPAAAPDCSGMWTDVYVCVGIAGPVATFSGTPPKPT